MSKDRDTIETGTPSGGERGGGSGGSHIRYKNQSPSTRRRSRDRERGSDKTRDIDLNEVVMTVDTIEQFDDSRLSDEMGYQSFTSEEVDVGGSTAQLVNADDKHPLHQRTNSAQALDRLNTKIACTRESIRKEQTARDDNVNEYLKLAANADKQQLQRIKAVFEKKNQKSAHIIAQLQKKLESYNKRAKDIQVQHTSKLAQNPHRQPREVLRDVGKGFRNVGGNIRDGITGLSNKPRVLADLLKNKFGSADNINQVSSKFL